MDKTAAHQRCQVGGQEGGTMCGGWQPAPAPQRQYKCCWCATSGTDTAALWRWRHAAACATRGAALALQMPGR